jgi:ubiquinone/menaquinone biosynthesis C-methylase UbiE
MGFYAKYILPKFLDKTMRQESHESRREAVVAQARGVVVEIGFGSGLNLPYYTNIDTLYAVEPSKEFFALAKERIEEVPFKVEHIESSAEKIPLQDGVADYVVSTWSLCTIPDPVAALREARRILKDGGKLVFIEHGRSPRAVISAVQRILNPFWRRVTGGCNLDRQIDEVVGLAGFHIERLEKSPQDWKPLEYSYKGVALK